MMSTNLAPKKDSNFIKCYFLRTRAESWRSHVSEKGQTLGMMSTKRFQFHKMLFSENQGWIRKVTCHWKGQNFGFDDNRHGPQKKIPILSNIIFWEPALWGNFVAVCLLCKSLIYQNILYSFHYPDLLYSPPLPWLALLSIHLSSHIAICVGSEINNIWACNWLS